MEGMQFFSYLITFLSDYLKTSLGAVFEKALETDFNGVPPPRGGVSIANPGILHSPGLNALTFANQSL